MDTPLHFCPLLSCPVRLPSVSTASYPDSRGGSCSGKNSHGASRLSVTPALRPSRAYGSSPTEPQHCEVQISMRRNKSAYVLFRHPPRALESGARTRRPRGGVGMQARSPWRAPILLIYGEAGVNGMPAPQDLSTSPDARLFPSFSEQIGT